MRIPTGTWNNTAAAAVGASNNQSRSEATAQPAAAGNAPSIGDVETSHNASADRDAQGQLDGIPIDSKGGKGGRKKEDKEANQGNEELQERVVLPPEPPSLLDLWG